MSFAERVSGLLARPGQDAVPKDDVPWWMRTAGRGLGTVGGGLAIFLGVWNCISIMLGNVSCLISGLWQMIAGFFVIVCEAPCCCMFVDFVQNLSDWVENRPHWNKAAIYVGISIPPILLCFGMSSLFGSGLIFATGVVYGMMSLGKKASLEEMSASASQPAPSALPPKLPPSSSLRSNLVENAAPMSFTGVPGFDSNV
ncbi:calcium channel flower [Arctopsyche grandis]|uniref:calcium channel flower n=1 Tax=Arctopsyche grandis TaxID=121162 RepID=UPI00406D7879